MLGHEFIDHRNARRCGDIGGLDGASTDHRGAHGVKVFFVDDVAQYRVVLFALGELISFGRDIAGCNGGSVEGDGQRQGGVGHSGKLPGTLDESFVEGARFFGRVVHQSRIRARATWPITNALRPNVRRRQLTLSPALSAGTRSILALRSAGARPNSKVLNAAAIRLKINTRGSIRTLRETGRSPDRRR